jgi:hypothetical protein
LHREYSFSNRRVTEVWQVGWSSGHHRHPSGLDDIVLLLPGFRVFKGFRPVVPNLRLLYLIADAQSQYETRMIPTGFTRLLTAQSALPTRPSVLPTDCRSSASAVSRAVSVAETNPPNCSSVIMHD